VSRGFLFARAMVTSLLVDGGSQIVYAVVNKARDPLAGVFEV